MPLVILCFLLFLVGGALANSQDPTETDFAVQNAPTKSETPPGRTNQFLTSMFGFEPLTIGSMDKNLRTDSYLDS